MAWKIMNHYFNLLSNWLTGPLSQGFKPDTKTVSKSELLKDLKTDFLNFLIRAQFPAEFITVIVFGDWPPSSSEFCFNPLKPNPKHFNP